MSSIADEILALLATGVDPLNVHDSLVPTDDTDKVVSVPLPLVVFIPADAEPRRGRSCGSISSEVYQFDVRYAGVTREQAEAARDRSRVRLEGKRPQHTGTRNNPISRVATLPIDRDSTYHTPGGHRLLFGVDQYTVVL